MKKLLFGIALGLTLSLFSIQNANAQQDEWLHGHKGIYSMGIGGTMGLAVGTDLGYYGWGGALGVPVGASINASGEYKVWKFIGLGWQTGINIFPDYGGVGIGIPLICKANVHIMDAANVRIADKLDVYAGLGVGAGPGIWTGYGGGAIVGGIIHVGPQAGVHYWFNDKIAVFGEVGWGATFINGGVTF